MACVLGGAVCCTCSSAVIGTSRTSGDVRLESAKWAKADVDRADHGAPGTFPKLAHLKLLIFRARANDRDASRLFAAAQTHSMARLSWNIITALDTTWIAACSGAHRLSAADLASEPTNRTTNFFHHWNSRLGKRVNKTYCTPVIPLEVKSVTFELFAPNYEIKFEPFKRPPIRLDAPPYAPAP